MGFNIKGIWYIKIIGGDDHIIRKQYEHNLTLYLQGNNVSFHRHTKLISNCTKDINVEKNLSFGLVQKRESFLNGKSRSYKKDSHI